MIDQLLLSSFQKTFVGNTTSYGQHIYKYTDEGKEQGDNQTISNKLITAKVYSDHLEGKVGLGVVPINVENKCKFAVIDIDIYDRDLTVYIEAIERSNFPLIPFRTKSGGLHIYLFFKEFVSAKSATDLIRRMAAALSLDILTKTVKNENVEIFPKQIRLQDGASGNWLNMPYYNYTDPKQYVIRGGKSLSLTDALVYIKEKTVTLTDATEFMNELPFSDGPPCLQSLYMLNPLKMNSGRNDYLFAFGTYLKKKDESFFEQALFEINSELDTPLPANELESTILKSLRNKEYSYKCTQPPICDFCNKAECKTRKFGVGREGGYFSELDYGKMQQVNLAQPYYEWEVKTKDQDTFRKLRFKNEEEIIKQDAFLRLCFRELHNLPVKMKQTEWTKLVNQSLNEIEVIAVDEDDDMSEHRMFREYFYDFLLNRHLAASVDQISMKRVFHEAGKNRFLFKGEHFIDYLYVNKNFRVFRPSEIYAMLQDMKVFKDTTRSLVSKKQIRVYVIAESDINENAKTERMSKHETDFDAELPASEEF